MVPPQGGVGSIGPARRQSASNRRVGSAGHCAVNSSHLPGGSCSSYGEISRRLIVSDGGSADTFTSTAPWTTVVSSKVNTTRCSPAGSCSSNYQIHIFGRNTNTCYACPCQIQSHPVRLTAQQFWRRHNRRTSKPRSRSAVAF